jgi:MFS family permease
VQRGAITHPPLGQDTASHGNQLLPKAYVGYVAAAFYLTNSLFSYLWGLVIPRIGLWGRRGRATAA